MAETIRVEGLAALDRALAELPVATQKRVLARVAINALKPFVARAKSLAPIDADPANSPKRPPGTLRNSIKAGAKLTRRQARFAKADGKSSVERYAGTADPAGIQTEFGNVHQAAQPWARPAWDATSNEALAIVKTELGGEIEKAAQRLATKAGKGR